MKDKRVKEKKTKEKKPKDPVIIALDVTIVILIIAMIFVGEKAVIYKMVADESSSFAQNASMMSFELQRGDYAGLIQDKYMNEFNGNTKPDAYNSLADYVEASFLYKIYDTKGYRDRAGVQKAAMDKARANMQELEAFADKIDMMFDR